MRQPLRSASKAVFPRGVQAPPLPRRPTSAPASPTTAPRRLAASGIRASARTPCPHGLRHVCCLCEKSGHQARSCSTLKGNIKGKKGNGKGKDKQQQNWQNQWDNFDNGKDKHGRGRRGGSNT